MATLPLYLETAQNKEDMKNNCSDCDIFCHKATNSSKKNSEKKGGRQKKTKKFEMCSFTLLRKKYTFREESKA